MNIDDAKGIFDAAKNEGRNRGIKEGDRSARVEIAKAMIKNGLPIDQITAYTNLTLVEIYAPPLESPEFPMKLQETPYMLDLIDGEVWEEVK